MLQRRSSLTAFCLTVTVACILARPEVSAQACQVACDINAGPVPIGGSPHPARWGAGETYVQEFVWCNGAWFFTGYDCQRGRELWKTDGTPAGTVLVRDIAPGPGDSSPFWLTCVGSTVGQALFFHANDGVNGLELWKSDGTAAGTVLVRDINPGPDGSTPQSLEAMGNLVVFAAAEPASGIELWRSDGTAAGTVLLRDIFPGGNSGYPRHLRFNPVRGELYFNAFDSLGNELWKTDGTPAGTNLFYEFETAIGSGPANPTDVVCAWGTTLYLSADDGTGLVGREPYVFSDVRGCALLRDVRPGQFGSNPSQFTPCWTGGRGLVFFTASDATSGTELWVTDGTTTGTMLVRDINPGAAPSSPSNLRCCNDRLFFTANNGTNGVELWASDGTTAGTYLVMDINPGPGASTPSSLVCCKGRLYFAALSASGIELWASDGTTAGTAMVSDIYPGASSSSPADLVCCPDANGNPFVLFSAFTAPAGRELWRSDGTNAGTVMVADIGPGVVSSSPTGLVCCGSRVYFRATTPAESTEPWVSDGTPAGTFLLRDLRPGAVASTPTQFTCCNGRAVFVASGEVGGNPIGGEVHVTDGTQAGTVPLADIYPGPGGSSPSGLVGVGSRVYFSAITQATGIELWRTDGTPSGTQLACDVRPGVASGQPASLLGCCCRLYFVATDPKVNRELHVVPEPGPTVEEIGPGCAPAHPTMHATPPFLGQVCTLRGECAPANHAGLVLLGGKPASPYAVPARCAGFLDFFQPWFTLGVVLPPVWTVPLPIPNNPVLVDLCLTTQTWWISLAAVTPFQTTNAVLLGL